MDSHPTFVVGVGQAGIRVMNTLAEVAEEHGHREKYDFVAMDTDIDMLGQRPDGALALELDHDDDFVHEDVSTYPYLTRELTDDLSDQGAMRRRSVGRYKLDSRGGHSYGDIYDALWERAKSHCNTEIAKASSDGTFNIYFIHSLGGGTGSGTFPLLAAMLDKLAANLRKVINGAKVYVAGVGAVPLMTFDPNIKTPTGDNRYFPNAYAAMSDLSELEQLARPDESLTLPIYSLTAEWAEADAASNKNGFELNSPPFDDYWLFGVNQSVIHSGTAATTGGESDVERINHTIARPLHAISKLEAIENWTGSTPHIGSFDQAEVRVPHREVIDYYERRRERDEKTERLEESVPAEITALRSRKEDLEALRQAVVDKATSEREIEEAARHQLAEEYQSGIALVKTKTREDLESTLDEIESEYGIEETVFATNFLVDRLDEEHSLPAVKTERKETINELWSTYDMSTRFEFGGSNAETLDGKVAGLRDFTNEKIDVYSDIVDNWDPGLVGRIQDTLPPHGPFESEREAAERVLAKLRFSLDELDRVESRWRRVNGMRQVVADRRHQIRTDINRRLSEINEEITHLQTERDHLQQEVDLLSDDIESIRASLATEQSNQRLTLLPVEIERLDEIEPAEADEVLTSLSAYVSEGLIDRADLGSALDQCLEFCDAELNRNVMDMDLAEVDQPVSESVKETWILYHEENEGFKDDISRSIRGQTQTSGEQSQLDHLSDPYRIEFLSFYRRGPVSETTVYGQLAEMAESGILDSMASQYSGDHRRAFAYPEWYSEEIRRAFGRVDEDPSEQSSEPNQSQNRKPEHTEEN